MRLSRLGLMALLLLVAAGPDASAQVRSKRADVGLTLNLPRGWKKVEGSRGRKLLDQFIIGLADNPQTFVTAAHSKTGVLMSGGVSRQHYPFSIEDLQDGGDAWAKRRIGPGADYSFLKLGGQWALRVDKDDRSGGTTMLTVDRTPAELNFVLSGSRSARDAAIDDLKRALRLRKKHETAENYPLAAPLQARSFGVEAVAGRWTNTLTGVEVRDCAPWFLMRKVPDWGHEPDFSSGVGVQLVDRASSREARIMTNRMSPVEAGWPAEQRRLAMLRDIGVKPEAKPLIRAKVLGENTKFYRMPVPRPTIGGIILRGRRALLIIVQGRDVADMEPAALTELGLCIRMMSDEEADAAMVGLPYSPRALRVDEALRVGLGDTVYDFELGLSWTQPATGAWQTLPGRHVSDIGTRLALEAPDREGKLRVYFESGKEGESAAEALAACVARRFPERKVLESEALTWCGRAAVLADLSMPKEEVSEEAEAEKGKDASGASPSKSKKEPQGNATAKAGLLPTECRLLVAPQPGGRRIVIVGLVPEGAPELDWKALREAMLAFDAAPEVRAVEEMEDETLYRRWGLTLAVGTASGAKTKLNSAPRDEAGLKTAVWKLQRNDQSAELWASRLADDASGDPQLYREFMNSLVEKKRYGRRTRKERDFEAGEISGFRFTIRGNGENREVLLWRVRGILWTLIAPVDADPMPWLEAFRFAE